MLGLQNYLFPCNCKKGSWEGGPDFGASPENTLSRGAGQNVVRLTVRDAPEARDVPTIAVGARQGAGFKEGARHSRWAPT